MPQLGKLPDLAASFNRLKICLELEKIPQTSLLSNAIHKALQRRDSVAAIEVVKVHAKDNRKQVVEEVGEELVSKIESL